MDWNDVRYFLAVARGGSTLAAGRELRVSQTTVARRVAALERALNLKLFDRQQSGYALTPAGEELVRHAQSVEEAAQGFAEAADANSRQLSGTVTVTTHEMLAQTVLAPMLREIHELHPEIVIKIHTSEALLDLGAGAADIAIRSTAAAEQPAGIVGRRLCTDDWALYCSREYADRHGLPQSREELKNHSLIGGGEERLWQQYLAFLRELGLENNVGVHHGSTMGLLSGVRSGFGLAVLPCVVADGEADLIRCFPPRPNHGRTLWLLTHERVRNTPRVRTVLDLLYARWSSHIRQIETKSADA